MDTERPVDRRLIVVAAWLGMIAIVAPALTIALPGDGDGMGRLIASLLALATPATLMAAGRIQRRAWMLSLGTTLLVVLVPLLLLNALGQLALLSLLVGPIVAALAVGMPLREVDTTAAAGFFGGGTIAVIGGFSAASAGRGATIGVVIIAAVVGVGVTTTRLLRPTEV